ncbi:MAG: 16S rRNA (cytidine(1402)-2'-O)-methyltransferase [Bacillota bacterium]
MAETAQLYICGTPIGNLKDITLRTLEILKKVDLIAAEDTRRTAKLLNKYDISTPLTSYHEHNEKQKSKELLVKMNQGKVIALVSDAGMPGISDPGSILINQAIKHNIKISPVPGPTALISALVVSGLSVDRFVFQGFIPRSGKERKTRLKEIKKSEITTVFYESPHRLKKTLEDLNEILQERRISILRELTKIHEEKIYGKVNEVLEKLSDKEIKGEIVIAVAGREKIETEKEGWEDLNIVEHVKLLMDNGYTKKEAVKKVAKERELPKREVYKEAVVIDAKINK